MMVILLHKTWSSLAVWFGLNRIGDDQAMQYTSGLVSSMNPEEGLGGQLTNNF